MIYLDTSAPVKKYVIERGTDKVRMLIKGEKVFVTSKLTYAERGSVPLLTLLQA